MAVLKINFKKINLSVRLCNLFPFHCFVFLPPQSSLKKKKNSLFTISNPAFVSPTERLMSILFHYTLFNCF